MGCGSSKHGAVLHDDDEHDGHEHHHRGPNNNNQQQQTSGTGGGTTTASGGGSSGGGSVGGGLGSVYKKKTVTYGISTNTATTKKDSTANTSKLPKTRDRMDSWAHAGGGSNSPTTVPSKATNSSTTTNTTTVQTSAATVGTTAAGGAAIGTRAGTGAGAASRRPNNTSSSGSTSSIQKMNSTSSSRKGPSSSATVASANSSASRLSTTTSKQSSSSRKYLIESQWRYLWDTFGRKIVDPADVHAVLDNLQSGHVNKLSAVEITFLQRKVRAVVKSLANCQQTKIENPTTNNNTSTNEQQRAKQRSDAIKAVSLAEKHHVLNETVLLQLLPNCIVFNAYTILLHLSPTLWGRVSELAAFASHKAKLEMDVNKQSSNTWKMPKPSIVPEIEQPPVLPSGSTFNSLCCLSAIAVRGTRHQKLQLLFYLAVAHLKDFLNVHMAGGVPTFLLEVDCDTVLSLPSLTHYHYYGTAFLPHSSSSSAGMKQHKQQVPDFCPSSSRQPVTLNIKILKQILQFCCTMEESASTTDNDNNNNDGADATATAPATITSTPTRRASRSRSYNNADKNLDGNSSSHHRGTASSPGKRRARSTLR